MIRTASILACTLLSACASTRSSERVSGRVAELLPLYVGDALDPAPTAAEPAPAEPSAPSDSSESVPRSYDPSATASRLEPTLPLVAEGVHESRTTFKVGSYSAEDADQLDDGFLFNASWIFFFSDYFATELEAGYLEADGEDSGVDAEVWGVPLMMNARVNWAVWMLDFYGGAGLGLVYYDSRIGSENDNEFLRGGNAFLGATVDVVEAIALGVEAKYYLTEDVDNFDASLDGLALMLTLGFSR